MAKVNITTDHTVISFDPKNYDVDKLYPNVMAHFRYSSPGKYPGPPSYPDLKIIVEDRTESLIVEEQSQEVSTEPAQTEIDVTPTEEA